MYLHFYIDIYIYRYIYIYSIYTVESPKIIKLYSAYYIVRIVPSSRLESAFLAAFSVWVGYFISTKLLCSLSSTFCI